MAISKLFDLSGKTAIVTGGSTGLGEQMAMALAEAGAAVVITARKLERLESTAERLSKIGSKILGVKCDVGDEQEVKDMIETTLCHFGKIDIIVNNAGTAWAAPAIDFPLDKWEQVLRTNLTGVFLCCQAVGRVMIDQGGGKIINLASVGGVKGGLVPSSAYNASKAAVINFTRDLAVQWAKYNINVNAIAPGWFPTNMSDKLIKRESEAMLKTIPMGRFGGETDLKGTVIYLASAASDYVTGHTLAVDGGMLA